jgi:hypothetical protein
LCGWTPSPAQLLGLSGWGKVFLNDLGSLLNLLWACQRHCYPGYFYTVNFLVLGGHLQT